MKPDGTSNMLMEICRAEYSTPISRYVNPASFKNRMRKISNNLRFFKNPYKQNLVY